MAAPIIVPTNAPRQAVLAMLALGTAKLLLADEAFVPDQDTLVFINDVTDEAAGTGYTTGGITMTSVVVNVDTATNACTIDADDVAPAGLSVPCQWAFAYVDTGTPATSPVFAIVDLSEGIGGNITCNGVQWDADGIVPFVAAA